MTISLGLAPTSLAWCEPHARSAHRTIDAGTVAKKIAFALLAAADEFIIPTPPEWMLSYMPARVDEILQLEEGWDSYGGAAIPSAVGENVVYLAAAIWAEKAPRIEPNPAGRVIVEWEQGDQFVVVALDERHSIVEFDVGGEVGEFELFGAKELRKLKSLVSALA